MTTNRKDKLFARKRMYKKNVVKRKLCSLHVPYSPLTGTSHTHTHTQAVGISALTGLGVEEFFKAVNEARTEYEK